MSLSVTGWCPECGEPQAVLADRPFCFAPEGCTKPKGTVRLWKFSRWDVEHNGAPVLDAAGQGEKASSGVDGTEADPHNPV